jgi:hypothetical protein
LLFDGVCNVREVVRQIIVMGWQSQRAAELLKTDVAMADWI